ncbi:MAG TPA: MarR family winged helix-turn-helix transcriptional regulator [Nitrososphaerales archaeon]|nr:MarR family winged helix-turn-helix transcriptional regulator [Nitrososphaerales archaeon]
MGSHSGVERKAEASGETGGGQLDDVDLWRAMASSWKRLHHDAEKNLMRIDLNVAELRILKVLREKGSSPMNRFASETMLSQPSITGLVDKLEERGLVERVRSREDRREVLIAITAKGDQAYSKGMDLHRQFVERVFAVLDGEEAQSLVSLLKKLADASDAVVKESEVSTSQ